MCLYGPIHLYSPIHLYISHTSVCPCMYTQTSVCPHTSVCPLYIYMCPHTSVGSVHPPYVYMPPYIHTHPHTSIHVQDIIVLWFYHCSRTNCRLYVNKNMHKNLYRNLDFCLAAEQCIKLQFMGSDSYYVRDLVHFVRYTYTSMIPDIS